MSDHKRELSQQEIEDIKDDVKFRTKTIMQLNYLTETFDKHCESSRSFRDAVTSLKAQAKYQWALLTIIFVGLLSILWRTVSNVFTG